MPDSRPLPRQSLRFAAIGILAGLMVMLPLGEVLRYQTDQVQALMAERALLDPLAQAVSLQRSLISHDDVASRVLGGRRQLEDERLLRQAEVDDAVLQLKSTLAAGLWERALAETDDLSLDWRELSGRISLRRIDASTSRAAHRLLVEQAVQVMDLVSAGTGLYGQLALQAAAAAQRGWAPSAPQPPAVTLAVGAALDLAQAALRARSAHLHEQLQRLHAARNRQLAGLALLALTLLGALAWCWRLRERTPPPPAGTPGDGQRRGHGRRNTDPARRGDAADVLIQHLRQSEPTAAAVAQPIPPPQP